MDKKDIAICGDCGLPFDMSDLESVFKHEHKGLVLSASMDNIKSKRVIKNAREIYPNCSIQFMLGVHAWIRSEGNFDMSRMYQESEDFKRGYYQASEELDNNFILE